ncbi:hypothetical protein IWZ00DRAFT_488541 [Phyllosticta capitalensis]|uniref:uncharacterized protein n=1 Tax=Phyllosticta capitalensis TaxID=121624 RepID=UPI00312FE263
MVYWNVLYHSDYENINIMLIKAENGGFPPTSRRYMQEWALEELAMLAQIPEGSPRPVHPGYPPWVVSDEVRRLRSCLPYQLELTLLVETHMPLEDKSGPLLEIIDIYRHEYS